VEFELNIRILHQLDASGRRIWVSKTPKLSDKIGNCFFLLSILQCFLLNPLYYDSIKTKTNEQGTIRYLPSPSLSLSVSRGMRLSSNVLNSLLMSGKESLNLIVSSLSL
jgi:hypothetical protein